MLLLAQKAQLPDPRYRERGKKSKEARCVFLRSQSVATQQHFWVQDGNDNLCLCGPRCNNSLSVLVTNFVCFEEKGEEGKKEIASIKMQKNRKRNLGYTCTCKGNMIELAELMMSVGKIESLFDVNPKK